MDICITCGLPISVSYSGDVGIKTKDGWICGYDILHGKVKSPDEIFKQNVTYFSGLPVTVDLDLATRLARKTMNALPYWKNQNIPILSGSEASEEELKEAMSKH